MHEKFKGVSLAIRQPHNLGNLGKDRLSPTRLSALSAADISLSDTKHILTHTYAHTLLTCTYTKEPSPQHVNSCKDAALSSTS